MKQEAIKKLKLAENIINRRWNEKDENYGVLVCACFALLTKFGEFYTQLIENIFKDIKLYIENKPLSQIINNHNINVLTIDDIDDTTAIGMSSIGTDFFFNKDGTIEKITDNPFIICSTLNRRTNSILNTIIHEFSHLIKSSINGYYYKKEGYFYIRNGFNIYKAEYKNRLLYELFRYNIIDEVINTFQTTEMMMQLEELKDYNNPGSIYDFLQTLDFNKLNELEGYEFYCSLLIDLWNNETFKNNVEDEIVVGNLASSINSFNSYTFENAFDTLDNSLDEISNIISTSNYEKIKKPVEQIKEIIKIYNKNTKDIVKKEIDTFNFLTFIVKYIAVRGGPNDKNERHFR